MLTLVKKKSKAVAMAATVAFLLWIFPGRK